MTGRLLRSMTGAAAAWLLGVGIASAQAPVLAQPGVSGNNVTFSWTATAGATNYRLDYGVTPGAYIGGLTLGNATTYSIGAPNGVFYLRVVAIPGNEASNEITLRVPAPPAPPTGLSVARNGTSIVATWSPGTGGGTPSGYQLIAGLTPGGTNFVIPTVTNTFGGGPAPANTYYFRVVAVNAAGQSGPSSEVTVVMPVGGACDVPPTPALTTSAWGNILSANWTAIPGASSYVLSYNGAGLVGQAPFGGTTTRFSYRGLPVATWQFGIQATFSCGSQSAVGASTLVMDNSTLKLEPRAADPAPGTALPAPAYALGIIRDLGSRYQGELNNSCLERGGNNRWLFRVVEALRQRDKRWGLNWKRANFGDMSQDIITYNWGSDADEGTPKLRAWDIIGNHCGSGNYAAQFDEKTDPEPPQYNSPGSNGRPVSALWTLVPYIEAGYIP